MPASFFAGQPRPVAALAATAHALRRQPLLGFRIAATGERRKPPTFFCVNPGPNRRFAAAASRAKRGAEWTRFRRRARLSGCGSKYAPAAVRFLPANPRSGRSSVVERQLPKLYVVGSIPIARSSSQTADISSVKRRGRGANDAGSSSFALISREPRVILPPPSSTTACGRGHG